ncbi:MAG: glycosyltransferase family 2 protein [Fibrobacterales bacterium]|nr:glycosyltransferase family 2 protein [Fibrobacterales bacterium]
MNGHEAKRLPTVSVIMAAWNSAETIAETIESVRAQTLADWELLVIDDGSTDDTVKIVRGMTETDRRIRLIGGAHRGAAAARNAGLQNAEGRYIAILDSDDFAMPERLAKQVAFLDAHPDVVVLGSYCKVGDEIWKPATTNGGIRFALTAWNPFVHSAVMFRKQAPGIEYNETMSASHDYDFLSRLCSIGNAANMPEVLCGWRIRRESIGTRLAETQRNNAISIAAREMRRILPEMPGELADALAHANFFCHGSRRVKERELRCWYKQLLAKCASTYPDDAWEIRRLGIEGMIGRRKYFFGESVGEQLRLLFAAGRFYRFSPKRMLSLIRAVFFD